MRFICSVCSIDTYLLCSLTHSLNIPGIYIIFGGSEIKSSPRKRIQRRHVGNNSIALSNLIPPTLAKLNGEGTKYRTHLNSITPSFDLTIGTLGIPHRVDSVRYLLPTCTYIHDEVIEDLHCSTRASEINAAGSFWLKFPPPGQSPLSSCLLRKKRAASAWGIPLMKWEGAEIILKGEAG